MRFFCEIRVIAMQAQIAGSASPNQKKSHDLTRGDAQGFYYLIIN
jgi:hypothetical protein